MWKGIKKEKNRDDKEKRSSRRTNKMVKKTKETKIGIGWKKERSETKNSSDIEQHSLEFPSFFYFGKKSQVVKIKEDKKKKMCDVEGEKSGRGLAAVCRLDCRHFVLMSEPRTNHVLDYRSNETISRVRFLEQLTSAGRHNPFIPARICLDKEN